MDEMSAFENYCGNLNDLCSNMQDAKETVSASEAERALEYARSIELGRAGDVLLFCASVNLMNAYVKQPGCRAFGYFFKGYVQRLVKQMQSEPIRGVLCSTQMDGKSSVTYVEVCGIQFSFHCVKEVDLSRKGNPIRFDGIRKQRCAVTLLRMAESNRLMRGNDLKKYFGER